MFEFFKKIFNFSSKGESQNFKKLKESLIKFCKVDNSKDYYLMWVNKYQHLSNEQYQVIHKNNTGFKKTDKIYIEYICYRENEDKVLAFVNNCSNDIYEFIIIDDEVCNKLGWCIKIKE